MYAKFVYMFQKPLIMIILYFYFTSDAFVSLSIYITLIIRYILLKYTTTFQIIHCKICQLLFLDRLNHLVTNSSIDSINW